MPYIKFTEKTYFYKLSTNDKKCLYSYDFWYKCVSEESNGYNIIAVGKMVEHLCYKNDLLSEIISVALLRALYKANYDNAKPVLEIMSYLLNIYD